MSSLLTGAARFLVDLFSECVVAVHDGDGKCAASRAPHGARLRGFLRDGLRVRPIVLIHSASTHYLSRDCGLARRFCRAFDDLAGTLYRDARTGALCLRQSGDHEWTGSVSEVLGVGLATEVMCQTLPARVAEVARINSTGVRCDYRIVSRGFTVVYEARGRSSRSVVRSAASGLSAKKAAHVAHYKYGVVSSLPNNGRPAEIFIFDPPGDEGLEPPSAEERNLQLARHYRDAAARAGLGTLARAIGTRIDRIIAKESWISGPVLETLPSWRNEVPHEGRTFLVGEEAEVMEQLRLVEPPQLERPRKPDWKPRHSFGLEFGLDSNVADALRRWDFSKLLDIPLKTHTLPERLLHLADDGSLLKVVATK